MAGLPHQSNGITIGQGAVIDVAGFVASSLNLSDADFVAGRTGSRRRRRGRSRQSRLDQDAVRRMVYLVGQNIENSGIIKSPQGEIILAAGKSIGARRRGTPEIRVQITAPDNQVLNLGQSSLLAAASACTQDWFRHGGTANANTAVVGENGKIVFKATKDVKLEAAA